MPDAGLPTPEWDLAIDFGTTTTAAAHTGMREAGGAVLPLGDRAATFRSSVFIESPDRIAVGDEAVDRAQRNPSGLLPFPKLTIGEGVAHANGYDVPAAVPVGAVLGAVLRRAVAAHGGVPPAHLVLTHPDAWSAREIDVLVQASRRLDLPGTEVRTESESRAAASHYSRARRLPEGARIAVVDFGGGTLDVAVLRAHGDGSFSVDASRGDRDIGGKNVDALIRRWLDDRLAAERPALLIHLRTTATVEERFSLDDSVRRAKELLSEARTARIDVPSPEGGTVPVDLHRADLERLISPLIDALHRLTAATLADAGIRSAYDLEALYLAGGSSRIPMVHRAVADLGPVSTLDDPKTAVALGALSAAAPVARHLAPKGVSGPSPANGAAPAPASTPPTPATATRGSRVRRNAVIAAVLVAAVAIAGGIALGVRGSGSRGEGAEEWPTSAAPVLPAADEATLRAAVPPALADALDSCKAQSQTEYGGIQFACRVKASNPLVEGATEEDHVSLDLAADLDNAAVTAERLRRTKLDGGGDARSTREEYAGGSIVVVFEPSSTDSVALDYANSATGITLTTYDLSTVDGARRVLRDAELLPAS